ncbi:Tautomerase enzyme [Tissierella creatinini]|nr:Tautomerase enzyme [Tissierella creatinini]TJX61491.1 Tautomerase enzyme [Soehngenia saccharolytica]
MPHIAITMYPGRSPEQKQDIANKVQKLIEEELGVNKKAISVSVEDIPKEKWENNMKQFSEDIIYIKPGV